jgi:hypothetical protein
MKPLLLPLLLALLLTPDVHKIRAEFGLSRMGESQCPDKGCDAPRRDGAKDCRARKAVGGDRAFPFVEAACRRPARPRGSTGTSRLLTTGGLQRA